jgi:potassium-dependent mechanosensitive channel
MRYCSTLFLPPCFALLFFLGFGLGYAQAQTEAVETKEVTDRQQIEARLATVRAEVDALPADADPQLREQLQQLEAACQYHLVALDFLVKAKDEKTKAESANAAWNGFPENPPFSIHLSDGLRQTLVSLGNSRKAVEAQIRIFSAELEGTREKLQGQQQAIRRYQEAVEKAKTPEDRVSAERSVVTETLSSRIAAEEISRLNVRVEVLRAEMATVLAKETLVTRQLKVINGKTSFSAEEFEVIQKRLSREKSDLTRQLVQASRSVAQPNPLLSWKTEFLELERSFWTTRFQVMTQPSKETTKSALATLKDLKGQTNDWIEIGQLRLADDATGGTIIDPEELRTALRQVTEVTNLIDFTLADLESGPKGTPFLDKMIDKAKSLWNAEIYLVEETDIVDGQKIHVNRAITLGKLAQLVLILVIGWLLLRWAARRTKTIVARSGRIPTTTADLAGKWAFGVGLVLLLLYGLNTVRIPLTVFAFLGGALAIGVGFGTQTILKNFISGIIILFERPVKPGDVVEVTGIIGTIREIGIRASVIQHFDGIETLVPNSILLENQLTNWNFSSTVIRHSLVVGVAYGTPTREVSRLLLAVADEHGLVAKEPGPEVRFENFGDNALVFRLLFWLDTNKTGRDILASDLRFMIDKAFSEAGLVMAFPQRDIHFDPETPLRVELSRTSPTKPTDETSPA